MNAFLLQPISIKKMKPSKSIVNGTMSMLINNNTRAFNLKSQPKLDFIQAEHKSLTDYSKEKIRVQIVNWLSENKKGFKFTKSRRNDYFLEIVSRLKDSQKEMIALIESVVCAHIINKFITFLIEVCK